MPSDPTVSDGATFEELTGAVARGWCHPENAGKTMDVELAEAIVGELRALIEAKDAEIEELRQPTDLADEIEATMMRYREALERIARTDKIDLAVRRIAMSALSAPAVEATSPDNCETCGHPHLDHDNLGLTGPYHCWTCEGLADSPVTEADE